mgnify:CR=1 FL=1
MHDHLGDRIANSVSHGIGILLSIIGLTLLMTRADAAIEYAAITIYGISLIVLYLFSTLHHSIKMPTEKGYNLLQSLDQFAIYLLIAGTYTPFVWLVIDTPLANGLLIGLWVIALIGGTLKVLFPTTYKPVHIILYVLMGWSILLIAPDLGVAVPRMALSLILYGGIAYTGGILFYIISHVKKTWHYTHLIWHLCVIAGSTLHFLAVYQIL